MNQASRIRLAKQLLHCARMVLDAEQFKEAKNNVRKIVANYAYDEFKNFISNYKIPNSKPLVDYLKKYGFSNVNGSGYVIHHFNDSGITHYIEAGKSEQKYQIYMDILQGKRHNPKMLSLLRKQIEHLVLLPAWFHNYIKHVSLTKKFTQRQHFYEFMESVLLTKQAYDEIKALKFDGSTIGAALKSIRNLAMVQNKSSDDIIKMLKSLYDNMQDNLIDQLTKPSQSPIP